jgi:hypothetical protein
VLPYRKAADEDGSFVIHGNLHLNGMENTRKNKSARFGGQQPAPDGGVLQRALGWRT